MRTVYASEIPSETFCPSSAELATVTMTMTVTVYPSYCAPCRQSAADDTTAVDEAHRCTACILTFHDNR